MDSRIAMRPWRQAGTGRGQACDGGATWVHEVRRRVRKPRRRNSGASPSRQNTPPQSPGAPPSEQNVSPPEPRSIGVGAKHPAAGAREHQRRCRTSRCRSPGASPPELRSIAIDARHPACGARSSAIEAEHPGGSPSYSATGAESLGLARVPARRISNRIWPSPISVFVAHRTATQNEVNASSRRRKGRHRCNTMRGLCWTGRGTT